MFFSIILLLVAAEIECPSEIWTSTVDCITNEECQEICMYDDLCPVNACSCLIMESTTVDPTNSPAVHPTLSPTLLPTAEPGASPVTDAPSASLVTDAPSVPSTNIPTPSLTTNSPSLSPEVQMATSTAPEITTVESTTIEPTFQPSSSAQFFKRCGVSESDAKDNCGPPCESSSDCSIGVCFDGMPVQCTTEHGSTTTTMIPTAHPVVNPSLDPTLDPVANPTNIPSVSTAEPNLSTVEPTESSALTPSPTANPTLEPSRDPTSTKEPTCNPTILPTVDPTNSPTVHPTLSPSLNPVAGPTTSTPTKDPTLLPTAEPSASLVTGAPSASLVTDVPSASLVTDAPSASLATDAPSVPSSNIPTPSLTTNSPSLSPEVQMTTSTVPEIKTDVVHMVYEVEGVSEENKDDVCQSVADASNGGYVQYCSLEGPARRRLLQASELFVDLVVQDGYDFANKVQGEDFLETLKLPADVRIMKVESVEVDGSLQESEPEHKQRSGFLLGGIFGAILFLLVFSCLYFQYGCPCNSKVVESEASSPMKTVPWLVEGESNCKRLPSTPVEGGNHIPILDDEFLPVNSWEGELLSETTSRLPNSASNWVLQVGEEVSASTLRSNVEWDFNSNWGKTSSGENETLASNPEFQEGESNWMLQVMGHQ